MTKQPTALHVEYDWTAACYRFRYAKQFIDIMGTWSCPDLPSVRRTLEQINWTLGPKSDSRSWTILEEKEPA